MTMKPTSRHYPNVVVRHNVVNQSTRLTPIRGIVLHDTEGANIKGIADLRGLGNFFDIPSVQASATVGIDAEGQSARYVSDAAKAWHVATYNSQMLGIEQIGFASQTKWPNAQLHETARWLAWWSAKYNIPLRVGKVFAGVVVRKGVFTHAMLGALGGGHHDPGTHYPLEAVIALAKLYKELQHG